ncbi:transposase, MuDR, MULE transposase domain protein [Tanacetum coccineum]
MDRDKIKSDGDISATEIMKWLMTTYNVDVPYMRAYRGKEQAYMDMYGKWEDSFMQMDVFRQELLTKNKGSIIDIAFEIKGDKKHFQRLFICLEACSKGFIAGCQPYISLDACHLKGKFNGVDTIKQEWFLELLKKAIGTPNGLVISSDMQKGLGAAITNVLLMFRTSRMHEAYNLGEYQVSRSSDNRAEVKYKGKRWEVLLDQRICSCRVWQVKGLPCVHAAAFIAFTRDANWDSYVDPYFTIDKLKRSLCFRISPIPDKDQWAPIDTSEKIYPPVIKRPVGRPKKNRIVPHDETKKRRKCRRCGGYGHLQKTCKRSPSDASTSQVSPSDASTSEVPPSKPCQPPPCKRGRVKNTKAGESNKSKTN